MYQAMTSEIDFIKVLIEENVNFCTVCEVYSDILNMSAKLTHIPLFFCYSVMFTSPRKSLGLLKFLVISKVCYIPSCIQNTKAIKKECMEPIFSKCQ